jgi:hypothetical protein
VECGLRFGVKNPEYGPSKYRNTKPGSITEKHNTNL